MFQFLSLITIDGIRILAKLIFFNIIIASWQLFIYRSFNKLKTREGEQQRKSKKCIKKSALGLALGKLMREGNTSKKVTRAQYVYEVIIKAILKGVMRAYSQGTLPQSSSRSAVSKELSDKKWKMRLSRQEVSILTLDPSLQKLRRERSLDQKNVQIKYVNTLKKVKRTSTELGCKVKVESTGFTLQKTTEKETQQQEAFNYNFGKEFNRYFKRKLVQKLSNCEAANQSLETTMNKEMEEMEDIMRLNKKSDNYNRFTSLRMATYLRGVSTEQKKLPYSTKRGLDEKFEMMKALRDMPPPSRKTSEALEEEQKTSPLESPIRRSKNSGSKGSKNSTSEKWTMLLSQFHDDIQQFEEICDFFQRIQHELLRYMPNNHLSNKINNIIAQVEHSSAIRKIYDQCNTDITVLTPQCIVKYLKKEEGILSCMNYIVNVIKLNISAERRKRFSDLQKVIGKYQTLTVSSVSSIADKLKTIDNSEIKKSIDEAVRKTNTSCRGLDPTYLQFVKQAEEQEFSSINSAKNRNIICEILKFESLMK